MERGRGSVATLLVQRGTLKLGDIFVVGAESGRVRALLDDRGKNLKSAAPGQPVEILGLNGTPMAGDDCVVVETEARAREIAEYRTRQIKDREAARGARGSVEQMLSAIAAGEAEELPVVIKTDVHGSPKPSGWRSRSSEPTRSRFASCPRVSARSANPTSRSRPRRMPS